RRIVFCFLFSIFLGGTLMGTSLTVMTYNIRHGMGIDGVLDFSRVVETIREVDPDILILNEVDQENPRSAGLRQAEIIAKELNMSYFFSLAEGRSNYGNAVLSKFPITAEFGFVLPRPEWMLAVDRGCSAIVTEIEGREVLVMATHLGLGGIMEIQTELRKILEVYLEHEEIPAIIAGDLNAEWYDLQYGVPEFFDHLNSVNHALDKSLHTIPADRPGRQIDYIFVNHYFEIVDAFTVASYASDHLPVVSRLVLK
ncbi:MAG: endonuclease/exonuclease/phosphatase family protein, partial [Mesotoga sp.]|nr:endonuclease/exonuclease/phosphatase family protein [Mesotoga sp.]